MTTIQCIPEEILSVIFKYLKLENLNQCQRVCQSWYYPAHILCLESVNVTSIQQFITTIDYNPKPAYLNAIKFIRISKLTDIQPLDRVTIDKVFKRFRNLTRVTLLDSLRIFATFNDQICQDLLNSCPNLSVFVPPDEQDGTIYRTIIPRLRLLLGEVDADMIGAMFPHKVITKYPRLHDLIGFEDMFRNFEEWLPFVDMMPNLKVFRLFATEDDQENFLETYLSTKPKDEQDTIVKRLYGITGICYYGEKLCVNSMAFLSKYLTRLNSLTIYTWDNNWTDQEWETYVDVLGWACSMMIDNIRINVTPVTLQYVSKYLPCIVNKVFHPIHHQKGLRVEIRKQTKPAIDAKHKSDILQLTIAGQEDDIVFLLKGLNINAELYYFQLVLYEIGNIYMCHKILKEIPPVTSVALDIKNEFKEDEHVQVCGTRCEKVKHLLFQTVVGYKFQTLLDYCSWMFPNLTSMRIQMSNGAWKEQIAEYQLVLADFLLQELSLDVSIVIINMQNYFMKVHLTESDFFIIELNCLQDSERKLFKVAHNLSSVCMINDHHLRDLNRRRDYLRVNITIEHLESLFVFAGQQKLKLFQ